jgi:hypothetical protein
MRSRYCALPPPAQRRLSSSNCRASISKSACLCFTTRNGRTAGKRMRHFAGEMYTTYRSRHPALRRCSILTAPSVTLCSAPTAAGHVFTIATYGNQKLRLRYLSPSRRSMEILPSASSHAANQMRRSRSVSNMPNPFVQPLDAVPNRKMGTARQGSARASRWAACQSAPKFGLFGVAGKPLPLGSGR